MSIKIDTSHDPNILGYDPDSTHVRVRRIQADSWIGDHYTRAVLSRDHHGYTVCALYSWDDCPSPLWFTFATATDARRYLDSKSCPRTTQTLRHSDNAKITRVISTRT